MSERRAFELGWRDGQRTYLALTRKEQLALIAALKWTLDLSGVPILQNVREFHPRKD